MKTYVQTTGEYTMPKEVYMKTLWTIRDYRRLCLEADSLLASTPTPTETPEIQRQRNLRATETQNLKYAEIMRVIRAIEDALKESVAPEDRKAVMERIIDGKSWPLGKSSRTYGRIQQKYVHTVATKLNYY